jgi:signal transduction histidine kinase
MRPALLLVDDSRSNLLAYAAVLKPLGRDIVTATSGDEAVQFLTGQQFALLLMDVRMPGIDGFETVELLRSQLQRATPVIFVTGADDDAAMRRAYEFGAVDYLIKPIDPQVLRGKVRNLVALYEQGIEMERQAALLLEQRQRLLEADAALRRQDTNIGILAHDLRNPLNAIVAGTSLLRSIPDLPEKAQVIAERIDRSAHRMTLMIRDIFDFARGRLGDRIRLNRRAIDLGAVCRTIADEVQAAQPAAEITVRTDGSTRGSWDQARIEQVLSNLLANAVEHGAGEVTLSISGQEPDELVFTVQNGGAPIPPEHLPSIFEPFHKVDQGPGGLGLGLFIVREIVRAHDGTIEAASTSEGTRFTIRLPRHSATGIGSAASDQPPARVDTPVPP